MQKADKLDRLEVLKTVDKRADKTVGDLVESRDDMLVGRWVVKMVDS